MEDYENIILITGAARSGTSCTAGIIDICGAFGGETAGPNKNNRKGMFENSQIRNSVIKPYLRDHRWDPLGQKPLPHIYDVHKHVSEKLTNDWRTTIMHIMERHGYEGGPIYYKGAKMCLIWPVWKSAFPKAKWIIVRRDVEDIVRSCLRTSFMRAYQDRSGWLRWIAIHEKRFEEMYSAGIVFAEVWPQRMINGDFSGMEMVIRNLGLKWDREKVMEFVEPKLWNKGNGRDGKSGP